MPAFHGGVQNPWEWEGSVRLSVIWAAIVCFGLTCSEGEITLVVSAAEKHPLPMSEGA
jgi:hypothetical protein